MSTAMTILMTYIICIGRREWESWYWFVATNFSVPGHL